MTRRKDESDKSCLAIGMDLVQTLTPAQNKAHKLRVQNDLRRLGVSKFGMLHLESRYLPTIIHPTEQIGGVVYGRSNKNYVMLVATDRRVLFLDKKMLFVSRDEATYDVVSGVSYSHAGPSSIVTLHTRIRDYSIRTYNQRCADSFVRYIESRVLEHKQGDTDRRGNWQAS